MACKSLFKGKQVDMEFANGSAYRRLAWVDICTEPLIKFEELYLYIIYIYTYIMNISYVQLYTSIHLTAGTAGS